MSDSLSRRQMLRATAGIAAATFTIEAAEAEWRSLTPVATNNETMHGVPFERTPNVRVGFIGLGGRGSGLLNDLINIPGVEIRAVCDLVTERAENGAARVARGGAQKPQVYGGKPDSWKALVARDDIDIVYIATPWDWHVPMAIGAMENGHHAATEVPAATTLADCWKLVDTSERTRKHCIMLENCCYGNSEMMVLNMVRKGMFGTITHGEAAYIHNLNEILMADSGEGLWRRKPHIDHNGNLYPTHGLGPVANYMDIHHGDRFVSMVSMSSQEAGLTEFRDKHVAKDSPKRQEKYKNGDMNTSLLKTATGRTVMLQHDVVSFRPYTRHNLIQGTRGTFADYPARICVMGQPEGETWVELSKTDRYKEFTDPLWQKNGDQARKLGGHGGMDYIMNFRLIQCLHEGIAPDMDVYDAAAWSAPGPLSELSIVRGGGAVTFPDFTRGNWKK